MAVPTISSVSPSTGPASGYREVEIIGTGFRICDPALFTPTVPGTTRVPTVSVTFDGVAALRVWAASSTLLRVVIPPYGGLPLADPHLPVDVVVTNLDDDGVAISGETVTGADAFTYERWEGLPPADDPPLLMVLQAFLARLAREVLTTSAVSTHVDFRSAGGGVYIEVASVPYIGLQVDFPRDVEYSQWDQGYEEVERLDGDIDLYRGMRTHRMDVQFTVAGEGQREALGLCGAIQDALILNPYIDVDANQDLYPGETDRYPIDITAYPRMLQGSNRNNVTIYSMACSARGIRSMVGVPVERVKRIVEAFLIETNMSGENQVTWQVF